MFAILLQAGPIIANMLGVAARVLNSVSEIECCSKVCDSYNGDKSTKLMTIETALIN